MPATANNDHLWPRLWWGAVICFILAALTGVLYRFGLLFGLPWGLQLSNVRHAHSHLMYFSWVTPGLMALMAAYLPRLLPVGWALRPRRFLWPIIGTFLFGLAAYPFYLLYGYQTVAVGAALLPLAAIIGTFNTIAWYGFIVAYLHTSWGAPRNYPLKLWDGAILMLFLASLGGWGLALASRIEGVSFFTSQAMTHLFLDLFADGWLTLAVLGLIYAHQPERADHPAARYSLWLLLLGLPLSFLLSVSVGLVPLRWRILATMAGLLTGAGWLMQVWLLRPRTRQWSPWHLPLLFLALRAVTMILLAVPQWAAQIERMNLRLSYLHWLLLGVVTLGLVAAARERWGNRAAIPWQPFSVGAALIILSLIPLSGLWPAAWGGLWAIWLAAIVAPIPAVVAFYAFMHPPRE